MRVELTVESSKRPIELMRDLVDYMRKQVPGAGLASSGTGPAQLETCRPPGRLSEFTAAHKKFALWSTKKEKKKERNGAETLSFDTHLVILST